MSNGADNSSPASPKSRLARWIHRVLGDRRIRVKFRLQGNHLYILCEGSPCPDQSRALLRLLPALKKAPINKLLPSSEPEIYQIFLYGRVTGHSHPLWQVPISLHQLDRHLEDLYGEPSRAQPTIPEPQPASAITLSNRSLARQGKVEAIAAYLSETLSKLGVSVQVRSRPLPYENPTAAVVDGAQMPAVSQRLWVTCEASYSPDPSLISEPVTQQLRGLELEGFRDAVVFIQVRGESRPDWVLRVDLTPAQEILKEWARWGDVDALTRLLNQALAEARVGIATTLLKQSTLHLTCCWLPAAARQLETHTPPPMERVRSLITQTIDRLGPQGIHQAVLYGQVPEQNDPGWVEWLSLPASQHQALAEPPTILARRGDWEAIAFLLSRLLNPNLDRHLATAGIRLKLLPKGDLLHVMCDAAICPDQQKVGRAIAKFLKSLRIPNLSGVRVYGRRAGQKRPQWSYGIDFVRRQRFVPEASPDFAATDALVGDLLLRPDDGIFRPDITPEDLKNRWDQRWRSLLPAIQTGLIRSQLFSPCDQTESISVPEASNRQMASPQSPRNVALIWGTVGLLLLLQCDWLLGQWLYAAPEPSADDLAYLEDHSSLLSTSPLPPLRSPDPAEEPVAPESTAPANLALPEDWTAADVDENAFDAGAFTQPDETVVVGDAAGEPEGDPAANASPPVAPLPSPTASPALPPINLPQVELADPDLELPLPSFNNPQLDQKLALYYQHLEQYGAPDVLIIGSSRALRGVDPTALQAELATLGYEDVTVFNFGVNGATAQVVDLVIRRLLVTEHLPKLILWADGARAFNSGRTDRTYTGIASSEAYRELNAGTLALPVVDANRITTRPTAQTTRENVGFSLQESYQTMDRWLSDRLAQGSTVHAERDQVKYLLQRQFADWLPRPAASDTPVMMTLPAESAAVDGTLPTDLEAMDSQTRTDIRGFLPLAVEFNPATYYQQYARVSGSYDRDYEAFRLEGQQAEATQAVLATAQEHGIPLVFVNMPLTDEYLDSVRLGYEQEFRQQLVNLSVNNSAFIFRDLGEIWLDQYQYFSDPSHLNRTGAFSVSQRLAQDPMIPWAVTTED
ncbi:hypothetical protein [Leptolyngbya sp. CCY15150]|uniref:hypothetical protein n=1 Tax=Leptolyngbya sp. CCY15150 TaxID=2767772 RepID=UPI0019519BED|nr:hypothetical protein [Leptolyngbya sp. CCY15150]